MFTTNGAFTPIGTLVASVRSYTNSPGIAVGTSAAFNGEITQAVGSQDCREQ